jgi:hypothetical protein
VLCADLGVGLISHRKQRRGCRSEKGKAREREKTKEKGEGESIDKTRQEQRRKNEKK